MNQLFIPDRIKVGFQERADTYTKKLAYVIYFDQKGVLRKETSWEKWRDKKIEPVTFDNVPTEGFVLNRHGGHTGGHSWYDFGRNAFIRCWDSRDFEFEISLANLLFILRECDCTKGKGLEGKFVYAWDHTELVLLPESSLEYQNSIKYTALQSQKISLKELVEGYSYETKSQEILVYLGRFFKHYKESWRGDDRKNYRVFHNGKGFVFLKDSKILARLHSDTIASNYAELVDSYNKSRYGSYPVKLFTKYNASAKEWVYQIGDYYYICSSHKNYNDEEYIEVKRAIALNNNSIESIGIYKSIFKNKPKYFSWDYSYNDPQYPYRESTNEELWVELESGSQFQLHSDYYGESY